MVDLIVIEGLDGAGKRTLANGLASAWRAQGRTVAMLAFPRYGRSVTADLGAEALRGDHGDLADSVVGMALMWALDRHAAAAELRELLDTHDIVLLDRYVASNAAYSAARMRQGAPGPMVDWVRELEFGRFGLPMPRVQVLLRVPAGLAARRAHERAAQDATRSRDAYERDGDLQARTGAVYDQLAELGWVTPWRVVSADVDPAQLAADLQNQRADRQEVTR